MIGNSLTFGRLAGIAVRVHYTWFLVAALMAWSLARGYFPTAHPGWPAPTYWTAGLVAALALFGSVLVHELGHALVAIRRGIPVRSITLFLFGGVATLQKDAETPRDELLIAVAGPATSFLLAGAFWAGQALLPAGEPAAAVMGYLVTINVLLGAFNLLPGFPLDGGRVLRSLIWWRAGSLRHATHLAAGAGQAIGFLLIVWGLILLLGGAPLNGLWIAVIGWFLAGAADRTRRAYDLGESLKRLRVADVMAAEPLALPPALSVDEFVHEHVVRRGHRALPVVSHGHLLGLVSVTDAQQVPREAWGDTPVEEIMTRAPLRTVAPQTPLDRALRLLTEHSLNQLPVIDHGPIGERLVGMIGRADILRVIQYRDLVHPQHREAAAQARQIQGVRHQAVHPVGALLDVAEQALAHGLVWPAAQLVVQQQADRGADQRQGRSQLVRDGAQQVAAQALHLPPLVHQRRPRRLEVRYAPGP
jgi:Zn-dependent protease/predicted transcriptional regulator